MKNVERENTNEQKDLDRLHDKSLLEMRNTAAMTRQTQSQGYTKDAAELLREQTLADRGEERTYQSSLIEGTQAREDVVREDEQDHNIDIEAMQQWQKRTESSSYKTEDGKWEMKVLAKGEIGPNGLPVEVDTFVVREPGTPFSFVQHGMHMLPHNYTKEEETKALALAKSKDPIMRKAKADLMSKAGTKNDDSSAFMDAYGYLPAVYFRKIRKADQSSPGAYQRYRNTFRQPANKPQAGGMLNEARAAADDTEFLKPDPLADEFQKIYGKPMPMGMTQDQRQQLQEFLNARSASGGT